MNSTKVAVVTGGNKGIGYGIVKGLCENFKGKVYLTARDESRGAESIQSLRELGLNPIFHQLDITDRTSIMKFRDYVQQIDGGIDVLVNNAGISYLVKSPVPFYEEALNTMTVNYFGTLNVCEILFPILRENAQVVNISSAAGHLSRLPSKELRSKFGKPNMTVSDLNLLINQFIVDATEGKSKENDWGSPYSLSKIGISALTMIHQRMFDDEDENRHIGVNSVHPGLVKTDMTNNKGNCTADEGAQAPLFLALKPHGWKGKYVWSNCTLVDWYATNTPAIV